MIAEPMPQISDLYCTNPVCETGTIVAEDTGAIA